LKRKTVLRQWSIPSTSCYAIKVDGDEVFIAGHDKQQILIYHRSSGILARTYGKAQGGKGPGEFYYPYGLTVDEKFIYICDTYNHRIQVLLRENGIFSSQWGSKGTSDTQFYYPNSIY